MSQERMRWIAALALIFAGAGGAYSASPKDQVPKVPNGPAGQYQYQILHSFVFNSQTDGAARDGPVVFDQKGNLYGATLGGGTQTGGTVFELTPGADGKWTETILYDVHYVAPAYTSFPQAPYAGLTIGKQGKFYGTGTGDAGMVFQLKL